MPDVHRYTEYAYNRMLGVLFKGDAPPTIVLGIASWVRPNQFIGRPPLVSQNLSVWNERISDIQPFFLGDWCCGFGVPSVIHNNTSAYAEWSKSFSPSSTNAFLVSYSPYIAELKPGGDVQNLSDQILLGVTERDVENVDTYHVSKFRWRIYGPDSLLP